LFGGLAVIVHNFGGFCTENVPIHFHKKTDLPGQGQVGKEGGNWGILQ
jgi:hypothetical protein